MLYETSKMDAKKGLKQILVNYLKERDRLRDFRASWFTIIAFFSFQQQTLQDVKAARDQFNKYLKMAALLNLYTTEYKDYIKGIAENYPKRLEVNTFQ